MNEKEMIDGINSRYWKTNLRVVGILLVIWLILGCVTSIWLVEWLNRVTFAGFRLGFWIANQGAMIGFILLIFTYAVVMNRIDEQFEKEIKSAQNPSPAESEDSGS
ncbi:MAG: DUF4212 domain-containing protein [Verrucomicrobia bacterium]|nr:DUF4212 domain-containing protein [Verrucomicrobiota bacterium]